MRSTKTGNIQNQFKREQLRQKFCIKRNTTDTHTRAPHTKQKQPTARTENKLVFEQLTATPRHHRPTPGMYNVQRRRKTNAYAHEDGHQQRIHQQVHTIDIAGGNYTNKRTNERPKADTQQIQPHRHNGCKRSNQKKRQVSQYQQNEMPQLHPTDRLERKQQPLRCRTQVIFLQR